MEDLKAYIKDADRNVCAGKMTNLKDLDKKVSLICQQATSLPPAQALDIHPLMAELIGELERLTISLNDYRDRLKS